MKDIRIISGKRIVPSLDTVLNLIGYKGLSWHSTEVQAVFEKLLSEVKMHIRPKAALVMEDSKAEKQLCKAISQKPIVYVMLTLGGSIDRLLEKYKKKEDMLSLVVLDAMADSCLFAFEEQLLPMIRQICLLEGYGIKQRLDIPQDLPMETQRKAFEALDAGRTLGLAMTSGDMLDPVKSMCMAFRLTEDTKLQNLEHDCRKCENHNCGLRRKSEILLRIEDEDSQEIKQISCAKGSKLLEVLRENDIFVPALCGGNGSCGKCGILVKEGELPVTSEDKKVFCKSELQKGMRLSCKSVLESNITISIREQKENKFAILGNAETEFVKMNTKNSCGQNGYGIAIDIGTTTLAFSLVELERGQILGTYTAVNPQRVFGGDVISRIQASNAGKGQQLRQGIRKALKDGIEELGKKYLQKTNCKIQHMVIAANTVMLHLLRGYSCEGFTSYPFAPETLEIEELTLSEVLGKPIEPKCKNYFLEKTKITLLPGISAFVGADIVAGLLACAFMSGEEVKLFLDLGTNGEMALKVKNRLYVASVAAGPAFEGGNLKWGMGSVPGAISGVRLQAGKTEIRTIEGELPKGICGTGVIEAMAELLKADIMDETGKLKEPYFQAGYPLAETVLGETITLTQQDIREIQMAKSAIRSGIEILIARAGISYEDISQVHLAGGFGYFLDVKKAAAIGILPKELINKTVAAGNTALNGALSYLADQDVDALRAITENAVEIPLATESEFQELYLKYMGFCKA